MKQHLRSLLPAVLLFCVGCPRTSVEVGTLDPRDAATGSTTGGVVSQTDITVLVKPTRELDILFMVDNSPSMDTKQEALAKTFPAMFKVLETMEGGLPDLHIGVISSDLGAGGGELGANAMWKPISWLEVHGYLGGDLTGALGRAAGIPRGGGTLIAGVTLQPFTWGALVIDLNGRLGPLSYFAPTAAFRFAIGKLGI